MLPSRKKKQYTHIIFDFDGTIANTLPQSLEVINRLLKRSDNPLAERDLSKILKLDSLREILSAVGVSRLQLPYYVYKFRKEMKNVVTDADVFKGMEEALGYLYDRATLHIVSSNSTENIKVFLEYHGIAEYFDVIEGGVSLFGKPRALRRTIKRLGIKKRSVLYVGDEVRDIVACKKVALDIASVAWGPTPKSRLKKAEPTYLLTKPKQLNSKVR